MHNNIIICINVHSLIEYYFNIWLTSAILILRQCQLYVGIYVNSALVLYVSIWLTSVIIISHQRTFYVGIYVNSALVLYVSIWLTSAIIILHQCSFFNKIIILLKYTLNINNYFCIFLFEIITKNLHNFPYMMVIFKSN